MLEGGLSKMAFEKRVPDYDGGQAVQIWKAIIQNGDNAGKEYLKVRIFGFVINCFQNGDKEEEKKE